MLRSSIDVQPYAGGSGQQNEREKEEAPTSIIEKSKSHCFQKSIDIQQTLSETLENIIKNTIKIMKIVIAIK